MVARNSYGQKVVCMYKLAQTLGASAKINFRI